jgi:hypothetical protein
VINEKNEILDQPEEIEETEEIE